MFEEVEKPSRWTLKSRSVTEHLLRGAVGIGLLAWASVDWERLGWWMILPLIGALVALRGCPMCWTAGLIATIFDREPRCPDGACAERFSKNS